MCRHYPEEAKRSTFFFFFPFKNTHPYLFIFCFSSGISNLTLAEKATVTRGQHGLRLKLGPELIDTFSLTAATH